MIERFPTALAIITYGIGQHKPQEVFDVIEEVRGFNWTQFIWLREPTVEESEWIEFQAGIKRYPCVHHAYRKGMRYAPDDPRYNNYGSDGTLEVLTGCNPAPLAK